MMARSWRDYAAANEPVSGADNSDTSDKSPSETPDRAPNVPIVTTVTVLPALLQDGLKLLAEAGAPNVRSPELWPDIVADALRLAAEGWASTALSLGWSELDLFGAVTDPQGDADADGLAVKLSGRKLLALCASFATVANANGGRSYLYKGNAEVARLLWALSRGR